MGNRAVPAQSVYLPDQRTLSSLRTCGKHGNLVYYNHGEASKTPLIRGHYSYPGVEIRLGMYFVYSSSTKHNIFLLKYDAIKL